MIQRRWARALRLFPFILAFAGSASACLMSAPNQGSGAGARDGGADGGLGDSEDAAAPAGDAGGEGADAGRDAVADGGADSGWPVEAADSGATVDAGRDAGQGPSDPCKGALVCDDFEGYAAGAPPGSPWTVSLSNGQGSVAVDTARAHSGSRSVKVAVGAASGYRSAMLAFQGPGLPASGNDLFGRMMLWLESAPSNSVHWTFIDGLGLVPGKGYHALYRYGGQHPISEGGRFVGSQLMANYETPDIYQSPPVGIGSDCWLHSDKKIVPVGRWACIEWRFDGSADRMQLWLDGAELPDLAMNGTGQGCSQQSASFRWAAPVFERIDLGWESYQADDARALWIDDVAIGAERIGCPRP